MAKAATARPGRSASSLRSGDKNVKSAVFHNLMSGGAKRTLFEMVRRLVPKHDLDIFSLGYGDRELCLLRPMVCTHRVYDFRQLLAMVCLLLVASYMR
jgi:hypothetical protein